MIIMLQEIKEIITLQKREIETKLKEKYIERNQDLKLDNDLIKVIVGPRRAGKSFFAIHFLNKKGKFGYVNFDDEKLTEVDNYDEIITAMNSIYDNPKFVLFDEIQNLPKWELFANRLQRQGYSLVITGSNSNLLSRELATHLTGRHLLTNIFPFSFKEYLKFEDWKMPPVAGYKIKLRTSIKSRHAAYARHTTGKVIHAKMHVSTRHISEKKARKIYCMHAVMKQASGVVRGSRDDFAEPPASNITLHCPNGRVKASI